MFHNDEEILQSIVDAMPSILMVVAEDLTIRLCNAACEEFTGEPRRTIVGAKMTDFIHDAAILDQSRSAMAQSLIKTSDMVMQVGGAGGNLAVRAVITPLPHSGAGGLCLLRLEDKTEHIITERKLARVEKRAEELRLLARSMAHELGNPLAIIRATVHHLANMLPRSDDDAHQAMAVISDSVDHVDDLLQQLSDFAATQKPEFKTVDLRHLIRKTLSLVDFDAQSQNITIIQEVDENLPACECDPTAVRALLLNLIRNAIESVPAGGEIRVKGYSPQERTETSTVCMEVRDNGPGIREEDSLNVFRPFFTTKPNGRGLGLSFCKRVAEEHDGIIALDTEYRQGARFVVSLPLQRLQREDGSP